MSWRPLSCETGAGRTFGLALHLVHATWTAAVVSLVVYVAFRRLLGFSHAETMGALGVAVSLFGAGNALAQAIYSAANAAKKRAGAAPPEE